ncbi:MAG: NADH-quinone oxidoreductase subunit J [Leptospiraceae bacterium]|nr:NADH-quinone oxidoreductase subunit J [Leptospiraceae bacterium]
MNLDFSIPQTIFFLVFSFIILAASLTVVLHKNPVVSAASLVLAFFGLAGIYATMNAVFIATMQVLVYAGAIMVLVIFVVMLLSLREETHLEIWSKPIKQSFIVLTVIVLGLVLVATMSFSPDTPKVMSPNVSNNPYVYKLGNSPDGNVVTTTGNTATVGAATFLDYLLPFELVSVLLLAAVVGAVVIAKREKLRKE